MRGWTQADVDRHKGCPLTMPKKYAAEKDLQSACETILTRAGYRRLTEENIVADAWSVIPGWFAHWPQAIGNPIMPDLVVWDYAMRQTLMVELKTRPKFRKAQKALITAKLWKVAFTADEFAGHLAAWIQASGGRP